MGEEMKPKESQKQKKEDEKYTCEEDDEWQMK
jgi:hypothetical protein